jgi:hypothetical protein
MSQRWMLLRLVLVLPGPPVGGCGVERGVVGVCVVGVSVRCWVLRQHPCGGSWVGQAIVAVRRSCLWVWCCGRGVVVLVGV